MALSVRRTWLILIIAVAGIAALTLVDAALESPRGGPAYGRINVSEKASVYLEFQGSELRAAMSAEGLKTAVSVKMPQSIGNNAVQFPEITLPIPADQLPAGITAFKARFGHY